MPGTQQVPREPVELSRDCKNRKQWGCGYDACTVVRHSKYSVRMHMNTHTGHKPFKCPQPDVLTRLRCIAVSPTIASPNMVIFLAKGAILSYTNSKISGLHRWHSKDLLVVTSPMVCMRRSRRRSRLWRQYNTNIVMDQREGKLIWLRKFRDIFLQFSDTRVLSTTPQTQGFLPLAHGIGMIENMTSSPGILLTSRWRIAIERARLDVITYRLITLPSASILV
ncbi:hypothetical protein BDZ89DRAFT_1118339 [Hymenopellis radicata]|nr:hypothetical protein BDZ89DRAFT_1118339 [Hymenopellis radicata]